MEAEVVESGRSGGLATGGWESRREGGRYPRAGGDAAGAVYTVPLIVSRDSVLAARDVRE
jgi:hypothetical protein